MPRSLRRTVVPDTLAIMVFLIGFSDVAPMDMPWSDGEAAGWEIRGGGMQLLSAFHPSLQQSR